MMERPLRLGVVGLGYWGPNIARTFAAIPACELAWCCDVSASARERVAAAFPAARFTTDLDELLADAALDAIAVATPVSSHADVAVRVLEAGKHCLVEKPLTRSVLDAQRVMAAQRASGRTLMVGHLLEYHPGVRKLKQLMRSGELGEEIYYLYASRLNQWEPRSRESVLWSLGAHEVSVILHLADEDPSQVTAHGESYRHAGGEDVVFGYLAFPSGLVAHLHLSWLAPRKERRFTIVGSYRMATLDDTALRAKLKIYDKGLDHGPRNYGEYITRGCAMYSPGLENREPLQIECEHFIDCIRRGEEPQTGVTSGLRVVRVLEQLQHSLDSGAKQPRRGTLSSGDAA